jgi:hypothetical protein
VPWYVEARLRQGAFATFLGLVVEGSAWYAVAVGDSCLFQVREGRVLVAFPLTRADDFGVTPWLIGSRTSPNGVPAREAAHIEGDWRAGDRLYLMTDALARWFLRECEAGRQPWVALDWLLPGPAGHFARWIDELRGSARLDDDDVTLVGVSL